MGALAVSSCDAQGSFNSWLNSEADNGGQIVVVVVHMASPGAALKARCARLAEWHSSRRASCSNSKRCDILAIMLDCLAHSNNAHLGMCTDLDFNSA